jgi:hypothetical protein
MTDVRWWHAVGGTPSVQHPGEVDRLFHVLEVGEMRRQALFQGGGIAR